MKTLAYLLLPSAMFMAACDADRGSAATADAPRVAAAPVTPPSNGDWSTAVRATPDGGFAMGNPNARVKLVEYASMTCHYCADFEEQGVKPLVDNYVKKGLVSFEFRNFVRDPFDLTASLIARCGGEKSFFGLTRNLYADQADWVGRIQAADPARAQALQSLPPAQQFSTIADIAGLKQYASVRGVPRAKLNQCLADETEINRLVQINSDAVSQYELSETPTFIVDNQKLKIAPGTPTWTQVEAALKKALAS